MFHLPFELESSSSSFRYIFKSFYYSISFETDAIMLAEHFF